MNTATQQPKPTSGTAGRPDAAATPAAQKPLARHGLAGRMDAEWTRLAGSPAGRAALRRWAQHEPALHGLADLRQLQQQVRTDPQHGDATLAALVRLGAGDGAADTLAARVVIQLLIPGALRLAGSIRSITGDWPTAESLVFAELAIGVATFPWRRRRHRIAANLLLDCRQRLLRSFQRASRETPAGLLQRHTNPQEAVTDTVHDAVAARGLLTWARHSGIIDDLETRLLLANRGYQIPITQLTRPFGRSRTALFDLRAAAERRLRAAVAANDHRWPHTGHAPGQPMAATPALYRLPRHQVQQRRQGAQP